MTEKDLSHAIYLLSLPDFLPLALCADEAEPRYATPAPPVPPGCPAGRAAALEALARSPAAREGAIWVWGKFLNHQGTTGFGPWFQLPRQLILGTFF